MRLNTFVMQIGAVAMIAGMASAAKAQTNASLMLRPWGASDTTEVHTDYFDQGHSHTRDAASDGFSLQRYQASGRVRIDDADPHSPAFGFDFLQYELHGPAALPDRLSDQSVAVGFGIGKTNDWLFGATVGGGFAGDNPYADGHAWYATANLIASHPIDDDSSLQLMLMYNGNRTFLPDIPTPGIAYTHKVDESLSYTAGLPYSSIDWTPGGAAAPLTLSVQYAFPYTVSATAVYRVAEGWTLRGGFYNDFNAFHVDHTPEHQRLFFTQRRIEGGVRWAPCDHAYLDVAAGFSFGQRFETGFDSRDLNTLLKVSDAPYFRIGVSVMF